MKRLVPRYIEFSWPTIGSLVYAVVLGLLLGSRCLAVVAVALMPGMVLVLATTYNHLIGLAWRLRYKVHRDLPQLKQLVEESPGEWCVQTAGQRGTTSFGTYTCLPAPYCYMLVSRSDGRAYRVDGDTARQVMTILQRAICRQEAKERRTGKQEF